MAKKPVQAKQELLPAEIKENEATFIPHVDIYLDIESTDIVASTAVLSVGVALIVRNAPNLGRDSLKSDFTKYLRSYLSSFEQLGTDFDGDAEPSAVYSTAFATFLFPLDEQWMNGRTCSTSTQKWWANQSSVVQRMAKHTATDRLFSVFGAGFRAEDTGPHTVQQQLEALHDWINLQITTLGIVHEHSAMHRAEMLKNVRVFSRGNQLDIASLETLYATYGYYPASKAHESFGHKTLWLYSSVMDVRSYLAGMKYAHMINGSSTPEVVEAARKISSIATRECATELAHSLGNPALENGLMHVPVYDIMYDCMLINAHEDL